MKRVPVSSSNIGSVGYDAQSNTLEVEFNDGSVYQYFSVPAAEHQGLMAAGSHGQYLASNIKGTYRYERL